MARHHTWLAGWVAVLLVTGCQGSVLQPSPWRPTPDEQVTVRPDGSFACEPAAVPSATDLARLSAAQYRNAVSDLFDQSGGFDATPLAADALGMLPTDGIEGETYSGMDTRLAPTHVRAFYEVADALADAVANDSSRRTAIFGTCADDAMLSASCIDAFLDDFALRAHRHPLSDDERARYHSLNDAVRTGPELVHALIFTALMSPRFLYHLELDGLAIGSDDGHFELDGHLLAARLSFHFWQTMPDQELFDAAADGTLLTEDGYRAQVERVFEDPRTREATATFYREWLGYDVVGGFPDTALFNAFAAGEGVHEPGARHIEAMREEIAALTAHYTWEEPGDVTDLLLSDVSVTQSAELAQLYGVEPWDGASAYPRFAEGERPGILSRAAFLINGEHETAPIHRGAIIRQRILCDEIAPPPATALPEGALDPPEFRPDMTTRERWEAKTENQPCAGCHVHINPMGFVLEGYDAIGRLRTFETLLDEATSEVVAEFPIDTAVTVAIGPTERSISEPVELMELLADSGQVEGCFARQYFRYTNARRESSVDGCALEGVRRALVGAAEGDQPPGTLREALLAIALDPSFRQRVVGEE